jgi:hypothetical protein
LYFLTPFFCEINGKRFIGAAGDCIIHKKDDKIVHGPLSEQESFVNNWMIVLPVMAVVTVLTLFVIKKATAKKA